MSTNNSHFINFLRASAPSVLDRRGAFLLGWTFASLWFIWGCDLGRSIKPVTLAPQLSQEGGRHAVISYASAVEDGSDWVEIDMDPETGRLRQELWINLTYIPAPGAVVQNVSSCFQPFGADQEIGILVCGDPEVMEGPLKGRHVRQFCGLSDYSEDQPPGEPVSDFSGCRRVRVALHQFSSTISLEVVNK